MLLALAAIKGNSVWDVVAMCSRVTFHCKGEEENYMPIMNRYASCVHAYHNLYRYNKVSILEYYLFHGNIHTINSSLLFCDY